MKHIRRSEYFVESVTGVKGHALIVLTNGLQKPESSLTNKPTEEKRAGNYFWNDIIF